jgi:WD40 repeat protein
MPEQPKCFWYSSNSSLTRIAGSCSANEDGASEMPVLLSVFDIETGALDILIDDYEWHNYYDHPTWSPDGNWVATYELLSMWPDERVDDGLYIMPADCLQDVDTCQARMAGPYEIPCSFFGFALWAKDSRQLAMITYEDQIIRIFDLATRSVVRTLEIENHELDLVYMDWLSNGDLVMSVHNQENRDTYDLIRYRMDTNQEEVLATGLEGPVLFTFTKE